jgi:hypothetical protein
MCIHGYMTTQVRNRIFLTGAFVECRDWFRFKEILQKNLLIAEYKAIWNKTR